MDFDDEEYKSTEKPVPFCYHSERYLYMFLFVKFELVLCVRVSGSTKLKVIWIFKNSVPSIFYVLLEFYFKINSQSSCIRYLFSVSCYNFKRASNSLSLRMMHWNFLFAQFEKVSRQFRFFLCVAFVTNLLGESRTFILFC